MAKAGKAAMPPAKSAGPQKGVNPFAKGAMTGKTSPAAAAAPAKASGTGGKASGNVKLGNHW